MNEELTLNNNFYVDEVKPKTQILLMDTKLSNMQHFYEWQKKGERGFKKTTPFTISESGVIYKHYDPKYTSVIFNDNTFDSRIIPIYIENASTLSRYKEKYFINDLGYIYKEGIDNVINKEWRDSTFWFPYSDKQIKSIAKLAKTLMIEFNIKNEVVDNNTYLLNAPKYEGLLVKSNYSRLVHDINPSFNFNKLKKYINER